MRLLVLARAADAAQLEARLRANGLTGPVHFSADVGSALDPETQLVLVASGPQYPEALQDAIAMRAACPALPIFVWAQEGSERLAVASLRAGVDYLRQDDDEQLQALLLQPPSPDPRKLSVYREFVRAMPIGMFVLSLDRPGDPASLRIRAVNRAALSADSIDEAQATDRLFLECFPHLSGSGLPERYAECIRTRRPLDIPEFLYRDRIYSVHAMPLSEDWLGVCSEDITDRRRAQETVMAAQQSMERAQRLEAIGRLAGGVAHDFNNLLTAVACSLDLLKSELASDSPLQTYVQEIEIAAERASSLTRQLLVFGRRQIMQPRVLNVHETLADVHRLLRRIIGEDISLRLEEATDAAAVTMDPGQLEQILLNLTVNARDAMPHGGQLVIRVQMAEVRDEPSGLKPGRYVRIEVEDTGCGIPPEAQDRLFEPFYTTKPNGTGLGLALVSSIARQYGGTVSVKSVLDVGTTFQVYLPAQDVATAEPRPATSVRETAGDGTILLVEDEDMLRMLATRVLSRLGYQVLTAANGVDALHILASARPVHLMITDIVMPAMNGLQLAAEARTYRPDLKVLFMSGYAAGSALEQASSLPEGVVMKKPFTPADLSRRVQQLLSLPVSSAPGSEASPR